MRTGLEYALRRVHRGESRLAETLLRMADKHHDDHEVHYVSRDLAEWSRLNVAAVAEAAAGYEVELSAEAEEPGPMQHLLDSAAGRLPGKAPGLVLLEDLRNLYLAASEASLAWEMLAQHAQARRERDLLELTRRCHPQTLRQIRWANTMIKTLSPQVLASLDA